MIITDSINDYNIFYDLHALPSHMAVVSFWWRIRRLKFSLSSLKNIFFIDEIDIRYDGEGAS